MLISVLVDSYSAVPIGNGMLSLVSIEGFLGWTSQMFIGAVTLILPVLVPSYLMSLLALYPGLHQV